MTEREFCIAANMISGIGYIRYKALREAYPDVDDIRHANRAELMAVDGIGLQLAERIIAFDWDAELAREMAIADRGGVRIYTLADEGYPDILRNLYDPPMCLYVRGRLPDFSENNAVAIVGSRRMSRYGERMTAMIAREAAVAGFTVVSGLAIGIDSVAHKAVLDVAGTTVAVIGSGLIHVHPKENIPLARAIVESGGAVISEFPLNFPVSRQNFPRRNRIVAGLCRGTLLMEAGLESGALITARLAMENGRDVFALPGLADNPQAAGCHRMIKDGANLMESFDDVTAAWSLGLFQKTKPEQLITYAPDSFEDLEAGCAEICRLLSNGEATLDELYEATGRDPGSLLADLMKLELKLLVERGMDQHYRLCLKRK